MHPGPVCQPTGRSDQGHCGFAEPFFSPTGILQPLLCPPCWGWRWTPPTVPKLAQRPSLISPVLGSWRSCRLDFALVDRLFEVSDLISCKDWTRHRWSRWYPFAPAPPQVPGCSSYLAALVAVRQFRCWMSLLLHVLSPLRLKSCLAGTLCAVRVIHGADPADPPSWSRVLAFDRRIGQAKPALRPPMRPAERPSTTAHGSCRCRCGQTARRSEGAPGA